MTDHLPLDTLARYAAAARRQAEATDRLLDAVRRLEALGDGETNHADWLDRRHNQVKFPGDDRRQAAQ